MEIFASKLSDKTVVDSSGSIIGKLHNISIDFDTGNLEYLLVLPDGNITQKQIQRSSYKSTEDGYYMIDASTVRSVEDQIIVG